RERRAARDAPREIHRHPLSGILTGSSLSWRFVAFRFDDIGNRLKAFRLASGLSADAIAQRLGISRAALYRFEKGELAKIDTLGRLAELLGVSVPTLLGVGVEYIASAVAYFERLRQIEETAER